MSKVKRHFVSLMRSSGTLDDNGQLTTTDVVVADDLNCSIEPLTGRELEYARSVVANATQKVTMYVDECWEISTKDWLQFGKRKLNIGHIMATDEIELAEHVLLCAEDAA